MHVPAPTQSSAPSFAPPMQHAAQDNAAASPTPGAGSGNSAPPLGVMTHISPQAHAAAMQDSAPPSPSSTSSLYQLADDIKEHAVTLGGQAFSMVRPAMECIAAGSLNVAYFTELFAGATLGDTRYFTKAEYTEQFDVGAVLGYVREALRAPTTTLEPAPATGASGTTALLEEAGNKFRRWVDRLYGPKTELIEYAAGGLAVGTAIGYLVKHTRS